METSENYLPSPKLIGYYYPPEQAYKARDKGEILSIRTETSLACNLRCEYCCNNSGETLKDEIPYEKILDVVKQAKSLGAKSVIIIGGGEPTVYPKFKNLIDYVASNDMIPALFTNALTMTKDLAKFLYEVNASVITKLDSLKEDVQDRLVGRIGAYKMMRAGLDNLMDAGFADIEDESKLRLGASFVVCKANIDEVPDIWKFCRQNRLFPNLEMMVPNGKAKDLESLCPTRDEWQKLKLELLDFDRKEFGYDWLPYSPLVATGCLQVLYNVYITVKGYARPCSSIHADRANVLLNVNDMPLAEIINTPFFQKARYTDKYIQGKCKGCEYKWECLGCRGMAFAVSINSGKDAYEAICSEDPTCFKQ